MASATEVLEFLFTPSKTVFIVGGLIVLLVPILLHLFITRSTPYTSLPSILLVGPSNAGKTALLTLLERGDTAAQTHTSQVPQSVELTVASDPALLNYRESARHDAPGTHKKFLLLDSPGHPKLRNQALAPILASSGKSSSSSTTSQSGATTLKGILYVLDAATLEDNLPASASYLYDILLALQKRASNTSTSKPPPAIPILIAANKSDLFTALPASLVKNNLEAEITRIRSFKSKGMLDSGVGVDDIGSEENDAWLGAYGTEKFTFAQMREFDIEVDLMSGAVLEGKVDKWWEWIAERI